MEKIPLMDLKRQYESIRPEIDSAIQKVLQETSFIGGPEKEAFEKEYAELVGSKFCIGVANGTDAIFLIFKALGIQPGDEIVTAANSFIASSETITAAGGRPVFLDVDEETSNLDLNLLEKTLEQRAKSRGGKIVGVLAVHLYGRMMEMPRLMEIAKRYGVFVVEDTAQAHLASIQGRQAGTWGVAGSYSFYPGKNLGAYGDAGAVVTDDPQLAEKIRKLANHGRVKKYDHEIEGFNSRLDGLQAAVLRVKMRHLPRWTALRREKAAVYDRLLANQNQVRRLPPSQPAEAHVYHLYVVRVKERDLVLEKLKEQGIEAGVHYPIMLPALKAYDYLGYKMTEFPVASRLQAEILSLPLFPEMTEGEQKRVVDTLLAVVS